MTLRYTNVVVTVSGDSFDPDLVFAFSGTFYGSFSASWLEEATRGGELRRPSEFPRGPSSVGPRRAEFLPRVPSAAAIPAMERRSGA